MSHKRDIRTGRERILTLSWLGDGQIFMSVVLGIVYVMSHLKLYLSRINPFLVSV